jgi:hypothetical protein
MACWPRPERAGVPVRLALLAALVLSGCSRGEPAITVVALDAATAELPQLLLRISLPDAVRDGLERGVALSFRLDVDDAAGRHQAWRELRYLPLTRQYQVRGPTDGYRRSYDSRAGALAALERWPLPAGVDAPTQLRLRLDNTRLPAPLVLPALFDPDWRLDSGTTPWPPGQP